MEHSCLEHQVEAGRGPWAPCVWGQVGGGQEMNYRSSDLGGERPLSLAWKRVVGMPIPAQAGGSRATCLA